jgi:precorrin-2 dehydrogenase / sirohydrochlorin ferrochelatase
MAAGRYPVTLDVAGRRVLVVGGGPVAARKVAGLVTCDAAVHVVAQEVGPDVRAVAGITWDERPYRDGKAGEGWRLVFTATGDPAVDARVVADAEAAGIWVNSADDPDRCTFTLPSVLRRGALSVAVATAGSSPAVAAWVRRRLESTVGPGYGDLVDLVAGVRDEIRSRGRSTEGMDWDGALDSGILDMLEAGQISEARERLHSWLLSSSG